MEDTASNRLGAGIKVKLLMDFPIVKETLERIGIVRRDKGFICPSCYCVHGRRYGITEDDDDEYYIVHFKELFSLDGRPTTFSEMDKIRLKTIVYLLHQWGLIKCLEKIDEIQVEPVDVIGFSEKEKFRIHHKYRFTRHVDLEDQEVAP